LIKNIYKMDKIINGKYVSEDLIKKKKKKKKKKLNRHSTLEDYKLDNNKGIESICNYIYSDIFINLKEFNKKDKKKLIISHILKSNNTIKNILSKHFY